MPEYLSPGVYVEESETGARTIEGIGTSTVGFIGTSEKGDLDKPTLITSWKQFVRKFGRYTDGSPYLAPAVHGFFANGGQRCYVVRVANNKGEKAYIGTDGGVGNRTGLQAFRETDQINIVCIPGVTSETVQEALIMHCETIKDRFCILDSKKDADIFGIQNQLKGITSEKGYAAIYYPWIKVPIETVQKGKVTIFNDFVPPSGYVSGVYARTDRERGVHKAPANMIINGAQATKLTITNRQQEVLNPLGINCIRSFPKLGIRVWGARTTTSKRDSEWKYINVRRLFIYLEESIKKGTQWVVFEPNNETLWDKVKQTITQFLLAVWRDGALMGKKPEEAFFIRCDRTTMTQDDIDKGKLIIMVGVAPVKPGEFVVFRIAQWAGGSEIAE